MLCRTGNIDLWVAVAIVACAVEVTPKMPHSVFVGSTKYTGHDRSKGPLRARPWNGDFRVQAAVTREPPYIDWSGLISWLFSLLEDDDDHDGVVVRRRSGRFAKEAENTIERDWRGWGGGGRFLTQSTCRYVNLCTVIRIAAPVYCTLHFASSRPPQLVGSQARAKAEKDARNRHAMGVLCWRGGA